jgi:hypothetical protein
MRTPTKEQYDKIVIGLLLDVVFSLTMISVQEGIKSSQQTKFQEGGVVIPNHSALDRIHHEIIDFPKDLIVKIKER